MRGFRYEFQNEGKTLIIINNCWIKRKLIYDLTRADQGLIDRAVRSGSEASTGSARESGRKSAPGGVRDTRNRPGASGILVLKVGAVFAVCSLF